MQVGYGKIVPKGRLPVFSVDTEEEAKRLIVATCPMGYDGKYYARELAEEQTLDNLWAFAQRVEEAHERIKKSGNCKCRKQKKQRTS